MPKVIDHEQRRDAIADALFDVLREGGLEAVTLSNVADRAGLAIGSVRHFLGTRDQMVSFAFATMAERIEHRVAARAEAILSTPDDDAQHSHDRLRATADILCEFLPLDAARRGEAIVWIEFETAARTSPWLAATSRRAAAQTARLVETILATAAERGAVRSDIELATETARLTALIDGLTLRGALHPDILDPDLARRAVLSHLRQLSVRPAADGA